MLRKILFTALTLLITTSLLMAQEISVPDLTGMNVPQAAAELNRIGLRLGTQTDESWSESQPVPEGGISRQSIEPGTLTAAGAAIDVTVLRSSNLRLLYDDNDLTIINITDKTVDLSGLILQAADGNQAKFEPVRLTDNLRGTQCVQMWSVNRNGPKEINECSFIQNWLTTTNAGEHFWVTAQGATQFNIVQNDTVRATCDTASPASQDQPLTCDFYLPSGGQGGDVAEYVYLVYTTERLLVVNTASDEWMRLNRAVVHSGSTSLSLGEPALFGSPEIVADTRRLAPNQCLLFKQAELANDPLPQPCDIIAQLDLPADQIFWQAAFELESRSGERYTCPAATPGKRTICAMPR